MTIANVLWVPYPTIIRGAAVWRIIVPKEQSKEDVYAHDDEEEDCADGLVLTRIGVVGWDL